MESNTRKSDSPLKLLDVRVTCHSRLPNEPINKPSKAGTHVTEVLAPSHHAHARYSFPEFCRLDANITQDSIPQPRLRRQIIRWRVQKSRDGIHYMCRSCEGCESLLLIFSPDSLCAASWKEVLLVRDGGLDFIWEKLPMFELPPIPSVPSPSKFPIMSSR